MKEEILFCSCREGIQSLMGRICGYFRFQVSDVNPCEFFLNSFIKLEVLNKAAKY